MYQLTGETQARPISQEEIVGFLRRYRSVILITFLAVVVGAYVTLQFMTEQYESQASLLVKLGRENVEVPTTVQSAGLVATGLRPEELNSEVQILRSRALIETVVDELGPEAFKFAPPAPHGFVSTIKFYLKTTVRWGKQRLSDLLILLNLKNRLTDREAAIILLDEAITAVPEKTSDVITVTTRLPGASLAMQVEQKLLEVYFAKRGDIRKNPIALEFFETRLAAEAAHLEEVERQRNAIRERWNLSSIPEQRTILLRKLADMQSEVDNDRSSDAMLAQQQNVMRQRLPLLEQTSESSQVQSPNPAVQAYKERLAELELEHVKLASRYLPGAEPLVRNEEEINSLRKLLNAEPPTLLGSLVAETNPVKRQFIQNTETNDVTLAGLRARSQALQQPISTTRAQLESINQGERDLDQVERELRLSQDSYLDIAKRYREEKLNAELDQRRIANVALLSPPADPIEPVSPRKLLIMEISIPAGLILGILVALLLVYLDGRIHSERDLYELQGVESLGVFDYMAELEAGASLETRQR
jgi:polysaccharide biosynthesis protein PslE